VDAAEWRGAAALPIHRRRATALGSATTALATAALNSMLYNQTSRNRVET
jgi:hypothetical protein